MMMTQINALYVHFPFCKKVCPFCSFAVRWDNPVRHSTYIDLIKLEFNLLDEDYNFNTIESVYIGGGTPSRLSSSLLEKMVQWLKSINGNICKAVWSIEANPDDITSDYATTLRELGFDRVSLGIQSFNAHSLDVLKRQHTVEHNHQAIKNLQNAGFQDINIDLMFGFPEHGKEILKSDLQTSLAYKPTHISAYSLNIEEKTALSKNKKWISWINENERLIAEQYEYIVQTLEEHKIHQYEVSNFSKPGFNSLQNLIYWNRQNYLGLGPGAHSFVNRKRWGNSRRYQDYQKRLEEGKLPRDFKEDLCIDDERDEFIMLSLRMKQGLDLETLTVKYQTRLSESWVSKVSAYIKNGYVLKQNNKLILTTNGLLLADEISSSLAATLPD